MAVNIYFGRIAKRKNSTLRPADSVFTETLPVVLKDGTSDRSPVFLLNYPNADFNYNYCKWGSWYYFVDEITYQRNNLVQVSCTMDVLATFKSEILNTTAFVSYSSVSGGQWLPDKRIPVKADCTVQTSSVAAPFWHSGGYYILSTVGKTGAVTYYIGLGGLKTLINNVQTENTTLLQAVQALDFSTVENALASLTTGLVQTGLAGNGYENAPACIRSCHWIPFAIGEGSIEGTQTIYLGEYNTNVSASVVSARPVTGSVTVSIPWQYSDWRRAYCEDLYLYLPLVGMVNLSSDSLTQASSITVNYSYTLTDGVICYEVRSGGEIIGTYGGSCQSSYPIGINQRTSLGEVAQTAFQGATRAVSAALSPTPNIFSAVTGAISTSYNVVDKSLSTHMSCIGGIGGGAGAGINHNIVCYSVAHSTSCEPSEMASVMGVPTMKPVTLSSCSGYCECVNAHAAITASGDIINAIDSFINSGFFIE